MSSKIDWAIDFAIFADLKVTINITAWAGEIKQKIQREKKRETMNGRIGLWRIFNQKQRNQMKKIKFRHNFENKNKGMANIREKKTASKI